ncbi:MAG: MerR family transcriptional regulator [Clostridia bacterium]|nr:MerR family transcriptional regulator [Clostridia bacterium]
MKTVKQISDISGVSVRTLHHYDSIGLLHPSGYTESGYRLYDNNAVKRLHCILIFRELGFPLKKIKQLVDDPDFDMADEMKKHIRLLRQQKEQTEKLISLAERIIENGDDIMDFTAFDKSKMKKYEQEAAKRYGKTDAYRQSTEKTASRTEAENLLIADGMMKLFARFGDIKESTPDSAEAKQAVTTLKDYITANYYECTNEILSGLGIMYAYDERFKANIDAAGGDGTALFVSQAIAEYTK